ncbi:putative sarcosine oxidase [Aspergillus candidus]|uniref:sarcosine oxidasee (formaldehyde-forming) n=1 Tax=Aspergillus candidus TaxID=41067 RepID=A0A2I2F0G1_ASPCN|nr:FAD dependent oxidoreductase [Aspergillus candidus]PLB34112.1 FAD dependent oxidoreductase [Aspergillus candidus]
MQHYDVAVVGLGALGSAAAYYAARRGKSVIAFEQFELGHVRGASHDTSRIVRTSNSLPEYVALAKSAYKDWADLEQVTGQKLLTITGGVVFVPRDMSTPFDTLAQTLDDTGVPYELLDAAEVKRRWPQFDIPDSVDTIYTPDTGIAHASKTVSLLQHQARTHGALLKENTPVERVTPQPSGGVLIETATNPNNTNNRYHAKKVILATDAWTNKLLAPLGVHIPLTTMQEQVTYFKPTDPTAFDPAHFPVWIWGADPAFYGFPTYGEPTIKAARDTSNNFMAPDQRTFVPSAQLLHQLGDFMRGFIPDGGRKPLRTVTCQYCITPDRQFVIAPLKEHPDVIVGLGAAHAFKFTPSFGRVLAELAVDGATKEDISRFGIPRGAGTTSKL